MIYSQAHFVVMDSDNSIFLVFFCSSVGAKHNIASTFCTFWHFLDFKHAPNDMCVCLLLSMCIQCMHTTQFWVFTFFISFYLIMPVVFSPPLSWEAVGEEVALWGPLATQPWLGPAQTLHGKTGACYGHPHSSSLLCRVCENERTSQKWWNTH